MNIKIAVVALAVVVALFVVSLIVGGSQVEGSSTDENGLVERLGDVAGDPSAVERDEVTAGCLDDDDPDLLNIVGSCVVAVRIDGDLRLLGMRALTPISIEAPAPDGDLEVKDDVGANKEVQIAVGDGTTGIVVSCPGGPLITCAARLVAV